MNLRTIYRKLMMRVRRCLRLRSRCLVWFTRINSRLCGGGGLVVVNCTFNVPVRVDGQGKTILKSGSTFGFGPAMRMGSGEILLQARGLESSIIIGENVFISNNVSMIALTSITIGDSCRIGDMVSIMDADFHEISPMTRNHSSGSTLPVFIGRNVWLGSRCMILKGVTIGNDAVVAAGSIVTRDIPASCIAAGVPAKIIRPI